MQKTRLLRGLEAVNRSVIRLSGAAGGFGSQAWAMRIFPTKTVGYGLFAD